MKVAFEKLPNESRIWIYQALKPINQEQLTIIQSTMDDFIEAWDSHGAPLQASYTIIENQFIVLGVNENYNQASGCSIDKSVAVFKALENKTGLSLLEKSMVGYQTDKGVRLVDFRAIKEDIASGDITPETKIYDITITTMGRFKENWPIQAKDTWVNRFLGVKTMA